DELVKATVKAWINISSDHITLRVLQVEATRDRYLLRRLADAVEEAAELKGKMIAGLTEANANHAASSHLAWSIDKLMVASEAAQLAQQVLRLAEDGTDIRDAAAQIAQRAMRTVMDFPRHVLSNGAGNGHRIEDIAQAVAASNFVQRTVAE